MGFAPEDLEQVLEVVNSSDSILLVGMSAQKLKVLVRNATPMQTAWMIFVAQEQLRARLVNQLNQAGPRIVVPAIRFK